MIIKAMSMETMKMNVVLMIAMMMLMMKVKKKRPESWMKKIIILKRMKKHSLQVVPAIYRIAMGGGIM